MSSTVCDSICNNCKSNNAVKETFNDEEMIEIGLYRKAMAKSIRMINLEQVEEAKKELIRILDNYKKCLGLINIHRYKKR